MKNRQIKTGSDLKKFRESIGLTQTELAKKCGYKKYNHISDMERGTVPLSAKMILAVMKLQSAGPKTLRRVAKKLNQEKRNVEI